jgi:translation initiation factor 1A
MVKNLTGGNKTKGHARKDVNVKTTNSLRLSENELEKYAKVVKLLGNGMCYVLCIDNVERLCHIRGKFKGKGKKDNLLRISSWILVGLREWESSTNEKIGKKSHCDLLEIYQEFQKEKLKQKVIANWNLFLDESSNGKMEEKDEYIEFIDDETKEYLDILEKETNLTKKNSIVYEDEIINVDDI